MKLTTAVKASYGRGTFEAQLDPASVPDILKELDESAAKNKLNRADARQFVFDAIRKNKHLTKFTGERVAYALLWLACRSPEPLGEMAMTAAMEGGQTIEYEITKLPGKALNFRLSFVGSNTETVH